MSIWTNHVFIQIGSGTWDIQDEKEMMFWSTYLLGHEIQHILSTTDKSWNYGLTRGFEVICEEFSRIAEKSPRRFYKESDFDRFLIDMKKNGYHISKNDVMKLVHFIMNSLEDGRIERIRYVKNPGYLNYIRVCRGKIWCKEGIREEVKETILDPKVYLSIILNQILCLSTMSIYQKGFLDIAFCDTHIHDTILELIPHIKKAVSSGTCRKCSNASWNFYKKLDNGAGNMDGFSIRVATKELLSRPEKNKLLFVLSDGLASCYHNSEDGELDVQNAVSEACKAGIHLVGIYFGELLKESDPDVLAFKKMYGKNYVITIPQNIEYELLRELKRFCFR